MSDMIVPLDLTPENTLPIFAAPDAKGSVFEKLFSEIEAVVKAQSFDIETKTGREELRAFAYKLTRSKTALDNAGKSLTEDWRNKTKAVNEGRKFVENKMIDLHETVRKPLTDFENAEAERNAIIERAMKNMLALCDGVSFKTSEEIELLKSECFATFENVTDWGSDPDAAQDIYDKVISDLNDAKAKASEREAQAEQERVAREKLAADQKALAEQQAEMERHQKEIADKQAAAEKLIADQQAQIAEQKAEAERLEVERFERIEFEKREEINRQKRIEQAEKDAELQAKEADKMAAELREKEISIRAAIAMDIEKFKVSSTISAKIAHALYDGEITHMKCLA